MTLLTPLGLLGLIGIIGLILIYILKPNFQQKIVSSTFVWKLSLKYKKKKLPISRFRNILLLICQVLILVMCAMILTQPYIPSSAAEHQSEKVAIIDASASMLAEDNGETRFERAVEQVRSLASDVLKPDGGALTVILADGEPEYIVQRMTSENIGEINSRLDELIDPDEFGCTYGTSDIKGAIELANNVLIDNPNTEVLLYTDTTYLDAGRVTVKDVTARSEWNAAVLDCTATLVENYYSFDIEIGCYGRASDFIVCVDIMGVNSEQRTVSIRTDVRFDNDGELHLIIGEEPETPVENAMYVQSDVAMYSYDNIFVYLENVDDSFDTDNTFRLYGGKKEELKFLYCSSNLNPFYNDIFMTIRENFAAYNWDIVYTEKRTEADKTVDPEYCKGYDFYLFEYTMPSSMPTDGIVMLVSPDRAPSGLGLTINGSTSRPKEAKVERGNRHAITDYMSLTDLTLNEYVNVGPTDGFEELLYCNGSPVLLLKDEPRTKVIVMLFSMKMSNAAIVVDFPMMMGSLFGHFFPQTTERYVYDAGSTVKFNARGNVLQVTSGSVNELYTEFPSTLKVTKPGVYTLEQPVLAEDLASAAKRQVEYFYVKVPSAESNIFARVDALDQPEWAVEPDVQINDLVLYFAIALVSLLFAEWLLQIKEQY